MPVVLVVSHTSSGSYGHWVGREGPGPIAPIFSPPRQVLRLDWTRFTDLIRFQRAYLPYYLSQKYRGFQIIDSLFSWSFIISFIAARLRGR